MTTNENLIIENIDKLQCQYEFLVKSSVNEKNITYSLGRLHLLEKVEEDLEEVKKQALDLIAKKSSTN